ncbi:cytochrome P450 [Biscogniauxia marginata]|nr:cytochrome P450 [Biscogniauxia marginata]
MASQAYEGILTSPLLALAVGCLLILYIVYSYASSWYRLREFDGPPLASLSYLWMFRTSLAGEQAVRYRAVSDRYGALARIGPNDLLTADPDVLRRMSAARSLYPRSNWYRAMRIDPYVPVVVSMTDDAAHDRRKAQLTPGYSGRENPDIEASIDEQIASLAVLIRRKYVSSSSSSTSTSKSKSTNTTVHDGAESPPPLLRPMDLAITTNYFTLDVITRIAYGREFGYLETDSDVFDYIKTTESITPRNTLLAEIPYLSLFAFSNTALKLFGPKPTDKEGIGQMMALAQKIVGERFGPDAKNERDMLGSFIRHGLPRRQCEAEVLVQIIAGSDTTATAIRGTMLYIMSTPHVYFRLQREIDDAVASGKASTVIYEGLRMNLPFSGLLMKEVPPEGDTLGGRFVPGGTRVAQSILAIQRSREIFGDDADLFRPERWLIDRGHHHVDGEEGEEEKGGEERKREMAQTVDLVFGCGRWGCIGKTVAFLELNKIYFELLRHFDFQLIDVKNPMRSRNYNMFFQSDMWVKVTERTGL